MVYFYPVKPDLTGIDAEVFYIARHDFLYLGRDHPQCPSQSDAIDGFGATGNPLFRVDAGCVYATENHPDGISTEPHFRMAEFWIGGYKLPGLVAAEGNQTIKLGTPAFVLR